MKTLKVDIYLVEGKRKRKNHQRDKHIRLILRGEAEGKATFADFDAFSTFIKGCEEFLSMYTPIPEAFLEAFGD